MMGTGLIVVITSACLVLGLIAWTLAFAVKGLPAPRWARIAFCGCVAPVPLLALGYTRYGYDQTFVEWVLSRPPRFYFVVFGIVLVGSLVAWLVLRDRSRKVDVRTFD